MKVKKEIPLGSIESIFKDKDEYLLWFKVALSVVRGKSKKGHSVSSLVPEYVEIDFNSSAKAPRLYFPKSQPDTVVVQLPAEKSSSRAKGLVREHKLPVYSSIKGRIEVAIADELAIKFKLLSENLKANLPKKRSNKSKVI